LPGYLTGREYNPRKNIMSLIDQIKAFLKEDANISEVEKLLTDATILTGDKVKEWIAKEENKPVYDSIVGKAITSHIEKEKESRAEWEKQKAVELLEKAKEQIAKENQKTPVELELEKIKRELQDEREAKAALDLKSSLQGIVSEKSLPIHDVTPFLMYGDEAESKLLEYAEKTSTIIEDRLKKITAEKFGDGEMEGDGNPPPPDPPKSNFHGPEHVQNAMSKLKEATQKAAEE
jgi:hypothetical protein